MTSLTHIAFTDFFNKKFLVLQPFGFFLYQFINYSSKDLLKIRSFANAICLEYVDSLDDVSLEFLMH